jgi:hypothetical protein
VGGDGMRAEGGRIVKGFRDLKKKYTKDDPQPGSEQICDSEPMVACDWWAWVLWLCWFWIW